MKFGAVPLDQAQGAILAHSVRLGGRTIRKGTRLTADTIAALGAVGVTEAVVARPEAGDVHEDEAAQRIAEAIAGDGLKLEAAFTGRCNLHATRPGVVAVDRAAVDRLNRVDPAITLATLAAFAPADAGQMVATVKIIPFAVARERLEAALATLADAPVLRVAPYVRRRVGLVATELPGLKRAVMDKTRDLLDERLRPAAAAIFREVRVPHETTAIADALGALARDGAELTVAFGAAATLDGDDVVPSAIRRAGGRVSRVGMPVDPGNLLVLGELGGVPVIGAPGCARSPKENGFDWVLRRLLADLRVTADDVAGLGVGGLLAEIAARPQRRQPQRRMPKIAAVILAAGQSRRMGGANKLTANVGGRPMVRAAAEAALASGARPVVVVTGHGADDVRAALAGLDVTYAHNADYADGLATSLKAGIAALAGVDGAVVMLGDMPEVDATVVDRLTAAFDPARDAAIVVPTHDGRRGNPVLWSARFFADLMGLEGDVGGRNLMAANASVVRQVPLGRAVAFDIDTPEALAAAGGALATAEA